MSRLGPLQAEIMRRALLSPDLHVMPAGARERKACRRLEARGALRRALALPDVWSARPHIRKRKVFTT